MVFLEILPSVNMVGFPRANHIWQRQNELLFISEDGLWVIKTLKITVTIAPTKFNVVCIIVL